MPSDIKKGKAEKILIVLKKLFPKAGMMLRYDNNWELLVSVVLSAQCTDKKVNEVTEKLFKKYRTLGDYVNADPREFERDVFSTGFYRAKTKNILAAAKMLKQKFGGNHPRLAMTYLCLGNVYEWQVRCPPSPFAINKAELIVCPSL